MHTGCVFLSFLGMYAGALSHSLSFRPHVSLVAKRLETRDSPPSEGLCLYLAAPSLLFGREGRKAGREEGWVGGWVGGWEEGRPPSFLPPPTWQNLVYAAEAMAFRMEMLCGPDLIASTISEESGAWLLSLSLR